MISDTQRLLQDFAKHGSEPAFRELVARYTDLVYSVALRLVDGDTQLAQDVTQTVFIDLARLSKKLSGEVLLGGWLHRHTCFVAATTLRSERRRRIREQQAVEMNSLNDPSETGLAKMAPILDEAINELGPEDRAAIVSRFFEKAEFRTVGAALGVNEDAARMRVARALEKLQVSLKTRGVSLSAAGLGAALGVGAVTSAPAGLAASVSTSALAGLTMANASAATFLKFISMTKLNLGIISAILVAGVAVPIVIHRQDQATLQERDALLQQQTDQLAQLTAENSRLSNLVSQATGPADPDQTGELLRLRGEVGVLKGKLASATTEQQRLKLESQARAQADSAEQKKQIAIGKLVYTKAWVMAFSQYASQNQGQCPTNFQQASSFLPEEGKNETQLSSDQFEITYQGSLNDITNQQSIIVLREKESVQDADGGAHRAYGFADGHSEIHKAVDGNFQPWEQQHMISSQPGQ